MGDAKGVEVYTVDSFRANFVDLVKEDLLEAARVLSESRSCGHEPAVAEGSLADVLRSDAGAAEEAQMSKLVAGALPQDLVHMLYFLAGLAGVRPEEGIGVSWEGLVDELILAFVGLVEVW